MRRFGLGLGLLVGACSASAAPTDAGVCWRMFETDGGPTFRVLSRGVENLESCAVLLEGARMLEGGAVTGAYRGQYIFATEAQITSSKLLSGGRVRVFEAEHRKEVQDGLRTLIALEPGG